MYTHRLPARLAKILAATLLLFVATTVVAQQQPPEPGELGPAIPPEVQNFGDDWPMAAADYSATRSNLASDINAENVSDLEEAWTFAIEAQNPFAGGMTAPPVVVGDTVYVQDMENNVFALDRSTGDVRWSKMYDIPTEGPNGLAVAYNRVFGGLGDSGDAFALNAETGEEIWRVNLTNNAGEGIDMAPTVYDNVLYISTVPGSEAEFYEGGQRGILYALDAESGETLWSWDTTAGEPTGNLWGNARVNSGGGLWSPLSVDENGNIYFGVGNPAPWPGTEEFPNGSSRPGPNNYTNSMVSLDPETGSLRWFHNARPHDLFDLDHHLTPILVDVTYGDTTVGLAIGAGKTGIVTAADRETGRLVWETHVGIHQNDAVTQIPEGRTIRVYPGALGGVETPMAYANGTVFVPIVNLYSEYSATSFQGLQNLAEGTGQLIALDVQTGEVQWSVDLPVINVAAATVVDGVVFTGTVDGMIRAYDTENGDELWTHQTNAGLNAPFAVAGDMLFVPSAGNPIGGPEGLERQQQLIAFQLPTSNGSSGQ